MTNNIKIFISKYKFSNVIHKIFNILCKLSDDIIKYFIFYINKLITYRKLYKSLNRIRYYKYYRLRL